jgi:ribosome-associated heat shock protein Hsp15
MDGNSQRIDKWLWFARVVKTRSLATTLVSRGAVRVNRQKISKPSHPVAPGDILTLAIGGRIRVLKVLAAGTRRGPVAEARLLHEDLSAPSPPATPATPASGEPEN